VRRRSDGGFTLVELLMATAISGAMLPVIAGALVTGWKTTDATVAHLADTGNRQRLPALVVRDIQSAATIDTAGYDTTCLPAGTLVARMRWADTVSGATVNRVATYANVPTVGDAQLVRYNCDNGGGAMTLRSSVVVLHRTTAATTLTCFSAAGAVTSPGCGTPARAVLTATDASGSFSSGARRRSL